MKKTKQKDIEKCIKRSYLLDHNFEYNGMKFSIVKARGSILYNHFLDIGNPPFTLRLEMFIWREHMDSIVIQCVVNEEIKLSEKVNKERIQFFNSIVRRFQDFKKVVLRDNSAFRCYELLNFPGWRSEFGYFFTTYKKKSYYVYEKA